MPRTKHRKGGLLQVGWIPRQDVLFGLPLRALAATLLLATGGIHLDLYLTGYGHIPTIGTLFLLQVIASFALGILVAASKAPLLLLCGALFCLGTLAGYLLSLLVGLFSFHEVRTAAGIAAGIVELVAAGALVTAAARVSTRSDGYARTARRVIAAGIAAAALALPISLAAAPGPTLSSSTDVVVVSISVQGFGRVLATTGHESLYLLSSEAGDRIHCTGGCLSIWPPLLVGAKVRTVSAGPGVRGIVGLVPRSASTKQVTYNGFPLYTYAGDSGPGESNGEGIVSFGGTWYLLDASARSASSTEVRPR